MRIGRRRLEKSSSRRVIREKGKGWKRLFDTELKAHHHSLHCIQGFFLFSPVTTEGAEVQVSLHFSATYMVFYY